MRDSSRGKTGRPLDRDPAPDRPLAARIVDEALGERTVWVDCDVLQADGGSAGRDLRRLRRAAPTLSALWRRGSCRAAAHAGVAAVSCGIVRERRCWISTTGGLCAEVDLNVVMTSGGRLVEVQGTAEGKPFDRVQRLRPPARARRSGMQLIEAAQLQAVAAPDEPAARGARHGERRQGSRVVAPARPRRRGSAIEVEEDAETYAGNALLKARAARSASGGRIGLGDDSGLEVAALGGEPGVTPPAGRRTANEGDTMRWIPGGESGNVEDRRGDGGMGMAPMGIGGTVVLSCSASFSVATS